ncbi:hypothetical protein [Salibacterium lacus]|uniref:Uncharacterized protein n=1 Tax=Salibacterium lacus TaxID=1898109 RepID=A0ABW5T0P0_9BACI
MSIDIHVTDDYRITSDAHNYIVLERYTADPTKAPDWPKRAAKGADPTPKERWREVKYCATIPQAARQILDLSVRQSDATSLAEVVAKMEAVRDDIDRSLSPTDTGKITPS